MMRMRSATVMGKGVTFGLGLVLLLCSSWVPVPGLQLIPGAAAASWTKGRPFSQEATVQCVQVGQKLKEEGELKPDPEGPFTIGAKQFKVRDGHMLGLDFFTHPEHVNDPFVNWKGGSGYNKPCTEWENFQYGGGVKFDKKGSVQPQIYTVLCASTNFYIRTYLVKQHGRVLRGWLHFELEVANTVNKDNEMQFVYVQIRDEAFNAIGEFVSDPKEQCEPTKKNLVSPTKYQFLPCSATGLREAKTSQAIFMASDDQLGKQNAENLKNNGRIPRENITNGIHFTWRLYEYWCNRHLRFRVDVNLWRGLDAQNLDKRDCKVGGSDDHGWCQMKRQISKFWLYPKWFGAADIALPNAKLNCSTLAIYDHGTLSEDAKNSWLDKTAITVFGDDYVNPSNTDPVNDNTGNQVDIEYKSCGVDIKGPAKDFVSFGGRCAAHDKKNASHKYLQGCNTNPDSEEFSGVPNKSQLDTYSSYSNHTLTSRLRQCEQKCEEPDITNPAHLKEIKSFSTTANLTELAKKKQTIHFSTLKRSRETIRASTFWQTRKYHGNLCILIVMFIMPVSHFLIRYYKETFMHHMSLGCAPFFWVHMLMCFAVPTFLKSGFDAMHTNVHNFGKSLSRHAVFHRWVGNAFVWMFGLMVCLGGLRPVRVRPRLVCMALHSVIGFVLYITGIVLVIHSSIIPSSPTLNECDAVTELPTGISFTAVMCGAWGFIDFVFHSLLTVVQFATDRRYGIRRTGFGLPFVPILPADGRDDLVGFRLRKVVLLVYVGLAATMTFITMAQLFAKDNPGNCTLGELSCDLSQTAPGQSSSPFGCAAFSLKYYAIVIKKYQINFTQGIH